MSAPRYARLASKALAHGEPPPATPSPAERAAAISALGAALTARARRRRLQAWALTLGAVAATFALAFGGARLLSRRAAPGVTAAAPAPSVPNIVGHPIGGGGTVVVSGAEVPLDDGHPLGVGSRLVTPEGGRADLSFTTGTRVVLGPSTDMTVGADGATQLLRLDAGALDLHVAKLQPGHRFLVDTPDSEVEVRGTRFRVAVVAADPACGGGVRTRVTVTEGVVSVRHVGSEDRVPAGDRWPAGCEAAPPPPATAARAAAGATPPGSTLAQQNDLFASAVAARHRGDARAALALLDRFTSLYPSSPLAEGVMVERMRILRGGSPAKAAALARDYLARFPNGFARAEAEAIVSGDP